MRPHTFPLSLRANSTEGARLSVALPPDIVEHPRAAPAPLLEDLRALPRAFWVLFAGTFINRFGTFVWPFLTIYLTRRGYSPEIAGAAIACSGFGNLCGSALGGWLTDRWGRRHTIVGGAFASAAAYMLLYFAGPLPDIMFCVFLTGVAGGSYNPATNALLADIVPEERRLRAYSAVRLALNAGFACGSACAGFLAAQSFFWLFAGDALSTAAFAVIAWTSLPHGLRASRSQAPWSAALADVRGNRAFHALFVGSLCLGLIMAQWSTAYSLHVLNVAPTLDLAGHRWHGTEIYGLLLAWNGVLVVVMELPLTGWILRFEPRRMMAAGYLLQGFGFAMNFFCHDFLALFGAMTIFTLGEMACAPVGSAYLASVSPAEMRGRYSGLLSLAWSSSGMIGPLVGTRLLVFHPALLWGGCALLGIVGALTMLTSGAKLPAGERVISNQ
jgi:MFS family permease